MGFEQYYIIYKKINKHSVSFFGIHGNSQSFLFKQAIRNSNWSQLAKPIAIPPLRAREVQILRSESDNGNIETWWEWVEVVDVENWNRGLDSWTWLEFKLIKDMMIKKKKKIIKDSWSGRREERDGNPVFLSTWVRLNSLKLNESRLSSFRFKWFIDSQIYNLVFIFIHQSSIPICCHESNPKFHKLFLTQLEVLQTLISFFLSKLDHLISWRFQNLLKDFISL